MTTQPQLLEERDLILRLPPDATGRKFDDKEQHGLSQSMKAVDFIVEQPDRILFIEFKDPENPKALAYDEAEKFKFRFLSGKIDEELSTKFRDSFLYEWASDRLSKPVHYLVLVAIESLDKAMLQTRIDELKRRLPYEGPASGTWKRRLAENCAVFNLATWNEGVPDFPVQRASSTTSPSKTEATTKVARTNSAPKKAAKKQARAKKAAAKTAATKPASGKQKRATKRAAAKKKPKADD